MSILRYTGNGMTNALTSHELSKLRKNAGEAYKKHVQYYQTKLPSLSDLENLLLGNKEKEVESADRREAIKDFQQSEAQENRAPYLSVQAINGHSKEETIALLRKTKSAVLSRKPVTVKDFQVAAIASSRIQQEQSQIVLNELASAQVEQEWRMREAGEHQLSQLSPLEKGIIQQKKLWEKAIERYSYQVNLKKFGFTSMEPSFFRIA